MAKVNEVSPRNYKTKELVWDKLAATRSRPRRVLPEGDVVGYLYPPARLVLLTHPLIQELPSEKLRLLFIQAAYRFMADITFVETESVNDVALKIANGNTPIEFPADIRYDALTVLVDEAYHAYVARDFMRQVEQRTGVKPLPKPTETNVSRAMALGKSRLPEALHGLWEIVAICIAENTLTQDLLDLTSEKSVNEVFHLVMEDHVRDEGRHSVLFMNILKLVWAEMEESARLAIGPLLPEYILAFLHPGHLVKYEREVLTWLGLPAEHIERILSETYAELPLEEIRTRIPITAHMIDTLKRCGVLSHEPTLEAFRRFKLVPEST